MLAYVSHSVSARGKVDHDQVPVAGVQQGQQVVAAGKLVHAGDEDRVAGEGVAVDEVGDHFPGQQFGGYAELGGQFVLPLLDQAAGSDDEHPVQIAAEHELLGVQTGHDRLASTGIIGEKESERGAWQQLSIHRLDLVGKRVHGAGGHRDHRIVQAGHADAQGLGH